MRVATRRQRAAWRVFGDAFDAERTARYRRRLKAVRGRPRRRPRPRRPDRGRRGLPGRQQPRTRRQAFEPLVDGRGGAAATRPASVLVDELDGGRYRRWLDGYVAFVQAEGHRRRAGRARRSRTASATRCRPGSGRRTRRVARTSPVMRWADVTTLHDLRIAAKWLRYTLEFVREALGPRRRAR